MSEPALGQVECNRCGESVAIADAGMLTQKNSKALWRYLCSDCLKDVGVPQGYELQRDLSHLTFSGTGDDESPEDAVKTADTEVLVDFRGQIVTGRVPNDELRQGRILMNRHQLALIRDVETTQIPLAAIQDVSQRQISEAAQEYFDDVIRIIYKRDDANETVFITVNRETLDKFALLLFQAVLTGAAVRVRHPVNVGGRPVNSELREGILEVGSAVCRIRDLAGQLTIAHDSILGAEEGRLHRSDSSETALEIRFLQEGLVVRSEFLLPSARLVNLFTRFVHNQLQSHHPADSEILLTDTELQGLVALYSSPEIDLLAVLDIEEQQRAELIDHLVDQELISLAPEGVRLTNRGYAIVWERFDQIQ